MLLAGCEWWLGEDDLARLVHLNESEMVGQLTERLSAGVHLTRAGHNCLLSINPLTRTGRVSSVPPDSFPLASSTSVFRLLGEKGWR